MRTDLAERGLTGTLIVVEGPDGSGKTTLTRALAAALRDLGVDVLCVREPGGCPLSERIRELVKDPGLRIDARAEALLFAASRAQLVQETIRPALQRGSVVIADRWIDSSRVYQGAARGLDVNTITDLSLFATGDVHADLVIVLDVSERTARERVAGRGGTDRMEQTTQAAVIRDGYRQLTVSPNHVRVSAEGTPSEVLAEALRAVDSRLPQLRESVARTR